MFCIAAFVVLAILGIFSAKYRSLAGKAWKCVARKTTFRKCDTSFKADTKNLLLGKLILKKPRLARFLDKWLDVIAIIFVVLTIWSVLVVAKSGLNLYVHGTCNPSNAESCSLGAEACSIDSGSLGFWESLTSGQIVGWISHETGQLTDTISRIPDRMKKWQPRIYTDANSSYYNKFEEQKPVAIEVIDPGCSFCGKLFANLKEADVHNNYNLTYIAYPIPNKENSSGYKFPHSYHIASMLEAIKMNKLNVNPAADWQILERIFTWKDDRGFLYQLHINTAYTEQQVDDLLTTWLKDIGYSEAQIKKINHDSKSNEVAERLAAHKKIVDDQIKTVKIPTLLLGERRFDGVAGVDQLRS